MPLNSETAWQTCLPPFFVYRLIARKVTVPGLCGDCPALRGKPRLLGLAAFGVIWPRPPFCYNSLIFNDLHITFVGPVLWRKRRRKPGFSFLRILRVSSEKESFFRKKGQNSPFREFRGHGNFEANIAKSACLCSGNGEKCRPIPCRIRTAPCPRFGFDEETRPPAPAFQNARAFNRVSG